MLMHIYIHIITINKKYCKFEGENESGHGRGERKKGKSGML